EQSAARGRIARGPRADTILIHVEEGVFGIMRDEAKTAQAISMAESEPIVRRVIAEKVRDRRVEVAAVENHEHVVDKVIDIEQNFVGRVTCAIRIVTLRFLVVSVRSEAVRGDLPEPGPCVHRAVSREDLVTTAGIDFYN